MTNQVMVALKCVADYATTEESLSSTGATFSTAPAVLTDAASYSG